MRRRSFIKSNFIGLGVLLLPNFLRSQLVGKLPNVLILGDSISIGYTPFVKKQLEGIATVYRPLHDNKSNENCQGTKNGLQHIDRWIGTEKWDIIHFNFGLHDLKHVDGETGKNSNKKEDPLQSDPKEYKSNLKIIVKKLKGTGAELVFATTTPYPEKPKGPLRDPGSSEIYNKIALKIMKKNDILVNDLYNFILPKMSQLQLPKNVHFSIEGSEALGNQVALVLKNVLNK